MSEEAPYPLTLGLALFISSNNKYGIMNQASMMGQYPGSKLALIVDDLIGMVKTGSSVHRGQAAMLIAKTGQAARPAIPVILDAMFTNDTYPFTHYENALERIAWAFKTDDAELNAIIAEIQAVIDNDTAMIARKPDFIEELATLVEASLPTQKAQQQQYEQERAAYEAALPPKDERPRKNAFARDPNKPLSPIQLSPDVVRTSLEKQRVGIVHEAWWKIESLARDGTLPQRADELNDILKKIRWQIERRTRLQRLLDNLTFHRKSGWQDRVEVNQTLGRMLDAVDAISTVILFGNRASREYRPDSDIDIAVVLNEELDAQQIFREHQEEWTAWLSERLPFTVDLHLYIDEATTPTVHRGIKSGRGQTFGKYRNL